MEILIGIVLAVIGLAVCFFGLRFWFILLPIFGALTGFYIGARGMQELFGTGFLATATSWIVGIIIAIVLALLSWFIWYAGAIILAGAVGASLFSGIFFAIYDNPWGWVIFIASLIGAIVFAIGALVLNLPIYIIIVNSALGGAAVAITGVLTMFGNVQTEELANGTSVTVLNEILNQGAGWLWGLLWIVLAVLGILFQVRSIIDVQLPEEKWVPARAA
jgi:hypothetical protein